MDESTRLSWEAANALIGLVERDSTPGRTLQTWRKLQWIAFECITTPRPLTEDEKQARLEFLTNLSSEFGVSIEDLIRADGIDPRCRPT